MEVRRRPFDPSNLPWAVSQCPFDPYRAGAKVYRAYRTGGQPAPQTTLREARGARGVWGVWGFWGFWGLKTVNRKL
jgi:hypothetical protein